MKLENKIKRYIQGVRDSNNTVDKGWFLTKLNTCKKEIIKEYETRLNIIYTLYHSGQYYFELESLKLDIEKKYNCKLITEGYFTIINVIFNI